MGALRYWSGRWEEAVELYERGRDVRERLGDPDNAALGTLNVGEIRSDQGRYDEAETSFRRALQVWRAARTPHGIAYATSFLGRLASRRGEFDDAMQMLRDAARLFTEVGAASDALETDALIAECLVFQGRSSEALDVATAALTIDERSGGQGARAPLLYRVVGYARLQAGETSLAREAFERSIEAAEARGAEFETAVSLAGLARARAIDGDPDPELERAGAATLERLGVVAVPTVPLPSFPAGRPDAVR